MCVGGACVGGVCAHVGGGGARACVCVCACACMRTCISPGCVQHCTDTTGTQLAVLYTVGPLYRGHHWDPAGCPVYSGTSL